MITISKASLSRSGNYYDEAEHKCCLLGEVFKHYGVPLNVLGEGWHEEMRRYLPEELKGKFFHLGDYGISLKTGVKMAAEYNDEGNFELAVDQLYRSTGVEVKLVK